MIIGICHIKNVTIWVDSKATWFIELIKDYFKVIALKYLQVTFEIIFSKNITKLTENVRSGFPAPNKVLQYPVAASTVLIL